MAMTARLDKVKAVYCGHIESVKSETASLKLQNGFVGTVGGLLENADGTLEREIKVFEAPAGISATDLHLIYNPEINYDECHTKYNALSNFEGLDASNASRAYELVRNDMFSVSKDGLEGTPSDIVVGSYVVAKAASHKLEVITALTEDSTYGFTGIIRQIENIGTTTYVGENGQVARSNEWVVIEVLSN